MARGKKKSTKKKTAKPAPARKMTKREAEIAAELKARDEMQARSKRCQDMISAALKECNCGMSVHLELRDREILSKPYVYPMQEQGE